MVLLHFHIKHNLIHYIRMKLVSPIKHLSLSHPMLVGHSSELYLASSIVLETACTMCLVNVNNNKLWFIPIYAGYGASFYLFPKCLDKFSLNLAYTLWSGFGIIFTFLAEIALKKEVFHMKKLFGIMTVIYGISLIK